MRFDVHDGDVRVRVSVPKINCGRLTIDYPATEKYKAMIRHALADLLNKPEYRQPRHRRIYIKTKPKAATSTLG